MFAKLGEAAQTNTKPLSFRDYLKKYFQKWGSIQRVKNMIRYRNLRTLSCFQNGVCEKLKERHSSKACSSNRGYIQRIAIPPKLILQRFCTAHYVGELIKVWYWDLIKATAGHTHKKRKKDGVLDSLFIAIALYFSSFPSVKPVTDYCNCEKY